MNVDQPDRKSLVEQSQDDWDALRSVGELFPGTALGDSSAQLQATGGWPEDLNGTPIILAGGDELALTATVRSSQNLALVLAQDDESASAARRVLDELGHGEITVAAGGDAVTAVVDVCAASTGPVRWIGLGEPSQLAVLVERSPELLARLRVTQLQVPQGAGAILAATADDRLAMDLVSANPADGEIGPVVAVAAAQLLPFIDFRQVRVGVDEADRFRPQEEGVLLWWGTSSETGALESWLSQLLEPGRLDGVQSRPQKD
jgi:hypothetical protein